MVSPINFLGLQLAEHAKIVSEQGVDAYVLVVLVLAYAATLIYTAREHRREHDEDRAAIERAEKRANDAEAMLRECLERKAKVD